MTRKPSSSRGDFKRQAPDRANAERAAPQRANAASAKPERGGQERGGQELGGQEHGNQARGKPERGRSARHGKSESDVVRIFGFHAVNAALSSPNRNVRRLFATEAAAARLQPLIDSRRAAVTIVTAEDIAMRVGRDTVHQGVLLEADPLPPLDLGDLADDAFIVILDQVTDPHNVGAILRTAAAFGVDALVTTERHSPAMTGVLAKSASGALEHVPMITVVNLARALGQLGERGFNRVGLDSDGPKIFADLPMERPTAIVLGAEGKGLRRLTRENCDVIARLDLRGPIRSLNVSNACAAALTLASLRLTPRA